MLCPTKADLVNACVDGDKHSSGDLLLAIGINFGIAQNGHDLSHLRGQSDGVRGGTLNGIFGVGSARQMGTEVGGGGMLLWS
jgi:hypothetical protein